MCTELHDEKLFDLLCPVILNGVNKIKEKINSDDYLFIPNYHEWPRIHEYGNYKQFNTVWFNPYSDGPKKYSELFYSKGSGISFEDIGGYEDYRDYLYNHKYIKNWFNFSTLKEANDFDYEVFEKLIVMRIPSTILKQYCLKITMKI